VMSCEIFNLHIIQLFNKFINITPPLLMVGYWWLMLPVLGS
jgi:hypothetical protein